MGLAFTSIRKAIVVKNKLPATAAEITVPITDYFSSYFGHVIHSIHQIAISLLKVVPFTIEKVFAIWRVIN